MRDTFETGISHPFLVKKGASLIAFLVLVQHLSPLLKPYSFCLYFLFDLLGFPPPGLSPFVFHVLILFPFSSVKQFYSFPSHV